MPLNSQDNNDQSKNSSESEADNDDDDSDDNHNENNDDDNSSGKNNSIEATDYNSGKSSYDVSFTYSLIFYLGFKCKKKNEYLYRKKIIQKIINVQKKKI